MRNSGRNRSLQFCDLRAKRNGKLAAGADSADGLDHILQDIAASLGEVEFALGFGE